MNGCYELRIRKLIFASVVSSGNGRGEEALVRFFVVFRRLVLVKSVNKKVQLVFFSLLILQVQVVDKLQQIAP